jgi:hypothetical protein
MEYFVETGENALMLEISVATPSKKKCHIIIYDPYKKNTIYTNREVTIDKSYVFKVRMPISPKTAKIYCNCEVKNIARKKLPRKFTKEEMPNYLMRSFVTFIEDFSKQAGFLNANRKYTSDDDIFNIEYYKSLPSRESGVVSKSPARIRANDGTIEVSANAFIKMTVFERMALLLHEYCHIYKNKNAESELESDRNSLFIFLGLGYPRYDAYKGWIHTFANARQGTNKLSIQHKERLRQIEDIINSFDEKFQTITFLN